MQDPTRETAFALLTAVLEQRQPLEPALDAVKGLAPRDMGAAHRLVAAVLRRLGTLDAALEPYLKKPPPMPVRHILRLGAAGVLLLQTPPHAAVSTAVALTRTLGLAPFAQLVNAVLRRIVEKGAAALSDIDSPRQDTPGWLWSSWGAHARVIALAHQVEAPLDITLRRGMAEPAGGLLLPTGSVRFPPGTRVADIAGFDAGAFWVQDAAAALPALLLGAQANERVADLCAAPGGKTAQLAAAGASVVAVDRDVARMARLRDNLRRCQLDAETVQADATTWRPGGLMDAVLVDAPCSATGTIRRHPDILHLKRPRDVQALTEVQDRLLDAAVAMLRPGGRLIYSVCSLQSEEAEPRIASVLAAGGVRHQPFSAAELAGLPEALTPEGFVRTHPGMWPERGGMDGFFVARLVRE